MAHVVNTIIGQIEDVFDVGSSAQPSKAMRVIKLEASRFFRSGLRMDFQIACICSAVTFTAEPLSESADKYHKKIE